ncbi:carbon-nitrogen hydrolase family protein [Agrobacterium rhizogenes]|uniref:nitrilase-related carbon-nitrogen hydrolase n=1 Tax=Rhizobium rhizogenes TaxID=359 RepID=UPI001572BF22|nr:nitrilase-related carbon-nitrogen hydrolase [Rhizobium rhizogenes]NTI72208.1 carbon-nitrogen hydrolase family protein [Rhizobium rhizogenes]
MFVGWQGIRAIVTFALLVSGSPASRAAELTVGLVQLRTADAGNFQVMKALAVEAKNQGAELVVYPEASDLGWLNPAAFTQAEPIPGRYSAAFAAIASELGVWVAAGLTERGPKAGPGSNPDAFEAYDAGILINPKGQIVIHHRQFNVVQNAFDPAACQSILNRPQCSYTPGEKDDIKIARTPFGRTAILVCADAYTYAPAAALEQLKKLTPDFVIVPWGVTAAAQNQCGGKGFNATTYASEAAAYLKSAFVVGANATGERSYGRFLPSVYCGDSGYASPSGDAVEATPTTSALVLVHIPDSFQAPAPLVTNEMSAVHLCPVVCNSFASAWNHQWKATDAGRGGSCGCIPDTGQ